MTKTDELELDLSWKSDLKTAWANRGDEYSGPSSSPSDPPDGKTVGGTTEDDLGSETTSLLPSEVDEGELTGMQESILEAAIMRPTASKVEVAADAGVSHQYVADICGRWLPDHPAAPDPGEDESGQTRIDEWTRGCEE